MVSHKEAEPVESEPDPAEKTYPEATKDDDDGYVTGLMQNVYTIVRYL